MPSQPDVPARNSAPDGPYTPPKAEVSVKSFRLADELTDCFVVTIHPNAPFWSFGPFATLPKHAVLQSSYVADDGITTLVFTAGADK